MATTAPDQEDASTGLTGTNNTETEKEKLIPPTIFHDDETHDSPPPSYFEMTDRFGTKESFDNTCTLVGAVLVTLFCCAPFGIVAIIKAMSARIKHVYGDEYATKEANRSAKRWIASGVIVGVLIVVAYCAGSFLYLRQLMAMQAMQQQQLLDANNGLNYQQQLQRNPDLGNGEVPYQDINP